MATTRLDKRPFFSGLAAVTLVIGLFIDILGAPEAVTHAWPAELGPADGGLPLALYAIAGALFVLGLIGSRDRSTSSTSRPK